MSGLLALCVGLVVVLGAAAVVTRPRRPTLGFWVSQIAGGDRRLVALLEAGASAPEAWISDGRWVVAKPLRDADVAGLPTWTAAEARAKYPPVEVR